jgi:uncharacterized iron-regulated membrane protein
MKAQTQRSLRRYHHYLGVFFTPAIIFFAFSGALQTLSLHEANDWSGKPAGWVVALANIHKKQSLSPPKKRRLPAAAPAEKQDRAAPAPAQAKDPQPSPVPLKIFTVLVALGLIMTSVIGIIVALTNVVMRRASTIALAAGTALPILFLFI